MKKKYIPFLRKLMIYPQLRNTTGFKTLFVRPLQLLHKEVVQWYGNE